jgi:hypothetical protein
LVPCITLPIELRTEKEHGTKIKYRNRSAVAGQDKLRTLCFELIVTIERPIVLLMFTGSRRKLKLTPPECIFSFYMDMEHGASQVTLCWRGQFSQKKALV